MGMRAAETTGTSDQFDDLIMDPDGASEGLSQTNQGLEEIPGGKTDTSDKGSKGSEVDPDLETWDNLDPNSQLNQLDDKEDKDEEDEEDAEKDNKKDEETKKTDDKGKEDEKTGKEGEEEKSEKSDDSKPQGKTLKLFQDGKRFEVPTEATVKVKVDGRSEKVTIQELRDNYSGQKAWDKKFTEVSQKNETLQAKENELTRVQTSIKNTMTDVKTSLSEALAQGGDPMTAVNKIVDMLNIDSYDFTKALFNSMSEELATLDHMDEYERKAYWLEKKNSHLQKKHESFEENVRNTKAQEDRVSKVDQLREAHGVSEEDFVSAYQQLSKDGKEIGPEQVIQYAANLPYLETSEELLTPYEDQLSDDEFEDMMAKISTTMKSNKSLSKEDVATYLAELYEVDGIVDELNNKVGRGGKEINGKGQSVPSQHDLYSNPTHESFEDFN